VVNQVHYSDTSERGRDPRERGYEGMTQRLLTTLEDRSIEAQKSIALQSVAIAGHSAMTT
jgi:hypothetical protein